MTSFVKSFFKNLVNTPQNPAERLAEIARMLGDRKSQSALSHAEELLA